MTDELVYGKTQPTINKRGLREYPKDYNPILEYWKQIKAGKVVVPDKIRRTYKKIVHDLTHEGEFFYSAARAKHIIEFAENYCRHSKGKWGGKPVVLELWEKATLATIFGFIDINGHRKYQEAVLIVAKKNGKSLLGSIVGLYLQVGDSEPALKYMRWLQKEIRQKLYGPRPSEWSENHRPC